MELADLKAKDEEIKEKVKSNKQFEKDIENAIATAFFPYVSDIIGVTDVDYSYHCDHFRIITGDRDEIMTLNLPWRKEDPTIGVSYASTTNKEKSMQYALVIGEVAKVVLHKNDEIINLVNTLRKQFNITKSKNEEELQELHAEYGKLRRDKVNLLIEHSLEDDVMINVTRATFFHFNSTKKTFVKKFKVNSVSKSGKTYTIHYYTEHTPPTRPNEININHTYLKSFVSDNLADLEL